MGDKWTIEDAINYMYDHRVHCESEDRDRLNAELAELRALASKAKANERDAERWRQVEPILRDIHGRMKINVSAHAAVAKLGVFVENEFKDSSDA